jgi:hypothetical protein
LEGVDGGPAVSDQIDEPGRFSVLDGQAASIRHPHWYTPALEYPVHGDAADCHDPRTAGGDAGVPVDDTVTGKKPATGCFHFIECHECIREAFFRYDGEIVDNIPCAGIGIECAPERKALELGDDEPYPVPDKGTLCLFKPEWSEDPARVPDLLSEPHIIKVPEVILHCTIA